MSLSLVLVWKENVETRDDDVGAEKNTKVRADDTENLHMDSNNLESILDVVDPLSANVIGGIFGLSSVVTNLVGVEKSIQSSWCS